MDDANAQISYRSGSTVEWKHGGDTVTGTFLYMGSEGDNSSGIYTYAYLVRHSDKRLIRILPTRLTFQ
jgi:hypothetical protein